MIPLNKIYRTSLPAEMIIDDFVEGFGTVSYEDYLMEFINCSALFLALSKGQDYCHIPKDQQSNGECDCYTSQYELDFKRLGTLSGMYAKRNLSPQKVYSSQGVLFTCIPRQTEGMETTLTNGLLRKYSVNDFLEIDNTQFAKFDRDNICPELDVQNILKTAKCKKNILYLYTDFIHTDIDYAFSDIIEGVESHINECFSNLFRFRDIFVTDKDSFLAVIVQGFMCIAIWQKDAIRFKEYIPLSKSPTFSKLHGVIDMAYSNKLILQ